MPPEQEDLQARVDRLSLFIEAVPASIAMFDREWRCLAASRRWRETHGVEAFDPTGQPLEAHTSLWPKRWRRFLERCMSGDSSNMAEDPVPQADGTIRWFRLEAHPWGSAGGAGGLLVTSEDITRRKAAERERGDRWERLRDMALRSEAAREEERARLSRDLQDDLAQAIAAAQLEVGLLENHLERQPVSQESGWLVDRVLALSSLTRNMQTTIQRISMEVRPVALDHLGLAVSIRQEVRRFEERTGLPVDLLVEAEAAGRTEEATALFRILHEALANVDQHAEATRVEVALRTDGTHLVLEVKDDGRGLPHVAGAGGGNGLSGMKERAMLIGGEVRIERSHPRGTLVRARIPRVGPPQHR